MSEPHWTQELPDVDGIELRLCRLDQPLEVNRLCRQSLSESEVAQLSLMGDDATADAFVIRRGTLRFLLGKFLGREAGEVVIVTGEYGKPALASGGVHFSVSSSKDYALFALSAAGSVGVDIEWIDPNFDYKPLIPDLHSDDLPIVGREQFFAAWCRKEAIAKAYGVGLARPAPCAAKTHVVPAPVGYRACLAMPPGARNSFRTP